MTGTWSKCGYRLRRVRVPLKIEFVPTEDYDANEIQIPCIPFTSTLITQDTAHGGVPYALGWSRQYDGLSAVLVELLDKANQEADRRQRPRRVTAWEALRGKGL